MTNLSKAGKLLETVDYKSVTNESAYNQLFQIFNRKDIDGVNWTKVPDDELETFVDIALKVGPKLKFAYEMQVRNGAVVGFFYHDIPAKYKEGTSFSFQIDEWKSKRGWYVKNKFLVTTYLENINNDIRYAIYVPE